MHHIKTGIRAREIMNRNFPIIDSSVPLVTCVKKMKHPTLKGEVSNNQKC